VGVASGARSQIGILPALHQNEFDSSSQPWSLSLGLIVLLKLFMDAASPKEFDLEMVIIREPIVVAPNTRLIELLRTIEQQFNPSTPAVLATPDLSDTDNRIRASCLLVATDRQFLGQITPLDLLRFWTLLQNQGEMSHITAANAMSPTPLILRQTDLTPDRLEQLRRTTSYCQDCIPILGALDQPVGLLSLLRLALHWQPQPSAVSPSPPPNQQPQLRHTLEQALKQTLEQTELVIWVTTLNLSQVIYISPSYERLWQNSAAALYQNPASFLDQIHVDDRQRVRTTLASLSNGETIESFQIVNSDGTVRWIRDRIIIITGAPSIGTPSTDIFNTDTSASKSLVLDQSEKRIYQVVHIMEDMTTQQQTRIEIQQLLEQQQQFNQLRSCFVAMTSHEFRTPLTVISSSVSILQQYGSQLEESKKQRHLQRIQNKVNQIIQWLDQSLLYNRLDVSQFEFNPTPVELVQFCANLVEELQMCMTQHTIQFSAQANGLINWSDETLLHYILTNLLSNSVKFSPQGSTIRFNLICRRETMEFQIQDEGIGIPFADQSKLFESFYRASNVNNLPGTGLGLAIVKKCVELHQGEITFTSQEGVGSTFTVAIPLNLRGR